MLDDLKQHLTERLPQLRGNWLQNNSGYEDDICQILEMQSSKCRYWDATWNQYRIEFKKGRNIWLDLVRYSEILINLNEEAGKETICLFFVPNQDRSLIEEIVCVETSALIAAVGLTSSHAVSLIQLMNDVARSLNAQASLTVNDVRRIKAFSVS
jgi:hypothetical protein